MENNENNQVELLESIKEEKPIIDKTKIIINNLKDPRKNKKTITMVLGVLIVLIAIVLFISFQKKFNIGAHPVDEDGAIIVETGTEWGNTYATFIQKEMVDYTSYDVALVDLDFNNVPEMLVKFKDKNDLDTLKVFYITEGEVFSTKEYHLYSLHLLYSVVDKEVGWYIHIKTTGEYGAYTSLDKMINGNAYDSDIKTTTESLLEEFKKAYVDAKFKIVFYQINQENFIEDIKTVVNRNATYEKDIKAAINKLKNDNADKEYKPPVDKEYGNLEYLIVKGRKIEFGTYRAIEHAGTDLEKHLFIVLKRDGNLTYEDSNYVYDVGFNSIVFGNDKVLDVVGNNSFVHNELTYTLFKNENGEEIH